MGERGGGIRLQKKRGDNVMIIGSLLPLSTHCVRCCDTRYIRNDTHFVMWAASLDMPRFNLMKMPFPNFVMMNIPIAKCKQTMFLAFANTTL